MKKERHPRVALGILLCMALLTGPVFALEDTTHQSDVTLGFKENDGPTAPIDPEDPDTGTELPGTGANGPLSMDWVSPIQFSNELLITSATETYNATNEKPYIQITDNRGVASGWKVTATLSQFQQDDPDLGLIDTLLGAQINFSNGDSRTPGKGTKPQAPAGGFVLQPDEEPVRVVTAEGTQGTGTWVHFWYPEAPLPEGGNTYIQLEVPGGAAIVGAHSAKITWILSDAP